MRDLQYESSGQGSAATDTFGLSENCRTWQFGVIAQNAFRLPIVAAATQQLPPMQIRWASTQQILDVCGINGRGERIRTSDLLVPNQAL